MAPSVHFDCAKQALELFPEQKTVPADVTVLDASFNRLTKLPPWLPDLPAMAELRLRACLQKR